MKLLCQPIVVSVMLLWSHSLYAGDWPTFRGDNDRSGYGQEKLKFPLQQRWVYESPSQPRLAFAGPDNRTIEGQNLRHRVNYDDTFHVALVNDRAYFGSSVDHQVRCVDLSSGKELWHFFTGGPVRLAPTVWKNQVFVGSDDGYAYSLDANTGKLLWKLRAGPEEEWFIGRGEMVSRWPLRTGITVFDGIAYFAAGIFPHEDVVLYAVDAKTGKTVWKRDTISSEEAGRNALSPQGYLLVNENYVFVPSGRALPACFDRKTGEQLHQRWISWRKEGVVGGTRAILADDQIYTGGPHQMIALNQKTGAVGFSTILCKEMVTEGEKHAYIIDGEHVAKMDRLQYAQANQARAKLSDSISAITRKLRNPGKDAVSLKDQLTKISSQMKELSNRGMIWQTPCKAESALLVSADTVITGSENQVTAYNAENGKQKWQAKVDGEVRGLASANGFLLVSTTLGKIYAFADANQKPVAAMEKTKLVDNPYPQDEWTTVYDSAAKEIIETTNIKDGFCLVLGAENGRLAFAIAKHSKLKVLGIEPSANKVSAARESLSQAGVYGHRVTIHQADLADIPYSNYFANLIVSDTFLRTGKLPVNPRDFIRHVKPYGGMVVLTRPKEQGVDVKAVHTWLDEMAFGEIGQIRDLDHGALFARGKLRGAANWTHQYGDPGNTASVPDQRVKGGLGVLWYGDPGPGKMVNRHDGAVGPLAVNGRLIVQGETNVMAYDAYNGLFLWEYKNPKTYRTGVFQNNGNGNLVASDDSVFVMEGNHVVQLDAATGKLIRKHEIPEEKQKDYVWNYVAYQNGILFGTATIRKELARFLQRRGRKYQDATDTIFAIDVKTGKQLWSYNGQNISAQTIALGDNRIFFVDSSITPEQRNELVRTESARLKNLKGKELEDAKARIKRLDMRNSIALNARTGEKVWETPVDVTDCSKIGTGGGELTLMFQDGVLVYCGANANGHYWKQFVEGEFKQRRLLALSAEDGKKLWSKDANYRHRPIIVESKIIAEPWAFELHSGKQIMRKHPLTGKEEPWSIYRPGHHCGMLTAAPNMLLFRSGFTGFYDLYQDSGTQHFAGHRLGCWINAIPANGVVMIPEASAGCVCQFSIASTIILEPREPRRPWSIYSAVGNDTPVERMALNLGAPGDRKDARGTIWLAYPRPDPLRASTLDLRLDLQPEFIDKKSYHAINEQETKLQSFDAPSWVYTSWAKGLKKCTLPLRGTKDGAANYTVRLFFADLSEPSKTASRVFNVKLNGKTVLRQFDPAKVKDADRATIMREFTDIRVDRNLTIELVPANSEGLEDNYPILNGIEVVRSGDTQK